VKKTLDEIESMACMRTLTDSNQDLRHALSRKDFSQERRYMCTFSSHVC